MKDGHDWLDTGREDNLDNYQDAHDNDLVKLNLGCGPVVLDDWINCDIDKRWSCQKHFDMNKFPYPFKSNYADRILLSHVLEHLDKPQDVIEELRRISKPNALIEIRVPHWSHFTAYGDLTHRNYFSTYIFNNLRDDKKLKIESIKLTCLRRDFRFQPLKGTVNCILNISPIFTDFVLCKFIPVSEIKFKLRVIK